MQTHEAADTNVAQASSGAQELKSNMRLYSQPSLDMLKDR